MAKVSLVIAGCGLAACLVGDDAPSPSPSAQSAATLALASPPPPPPPRVECADLPGASRTGLRASRDGKTLYYIEAASTRLGDDRITTHNLYALDVASRAARLVVSDVGRDTAVAADGTVVFTRPIGKVNILGLKAHVLMVMPPNKEPVAITDPKHEVGAFRIDDASGAIVYVAWGSHRTEIWTVPLAGDDKPRRVSQGDQIFGTTAPPAVVISRGNKLVKQPLDGGKSVELADLKGNYVMGVHGDRLFLKDRSTKVVTTVPLADPASRAGLEGAAEDVELVIAGDQAHLVSSREDVHTVYELADPKRPILIARGAKPTGIAKLGERLAVLATIDTDADGQHVAASDEVDLCFTTAGPEPAGFPVRSIPKRFAEVVARLAPLTAAGPLAGAKLRFTTDDVDEYVELSAASGPGELAALRELAAQTQTRVTQLSGLAQLSVAIQIRDNGRRAISAWDAAAGAFLVSAGIGMAQVSDRRQYQLEIDPKIHITREFAGLMVGKALCTGTVKNISDRELVNLEAECASQHYAEERRAKAKVRPSKLAANATGTYRIWLGEIDGLSPSTLRLFADQVPVRYFNAYAQRRHEATFDVALKVYDETRLAYWSMRERSRGASSRKEVLVAVRPDPAFEKATDEVRAGAAAKALARFAALIKAGKDFEGEPVLLILRGEGYKIGWTYAAGKLTAGEPRGL